MIASFLSAFGCVTGGGSEPDVIAKVIFEAAADESDILRFPAGEDAKAMLKERRATSDEDHQKKMTSQFKLLE